MAVLRFVVTEKSQRWFAEENHNEEDPLPYFGLRLSNSGVIWICIIVESNGPLGPHIK